MSSPESKTATVRVSAGSVLQHLPLIRINIEKVYKKYKDEAHETYSQRLLDDIISTQNDLASGWWTRFTGESKRILDCVFTIHDASLILASCRTQLERSQIRFSPMEELIFQKYWSDGCYTGWMSKPVNVDYYFTRIEYLQDCMNNDNQKIDELERACNLVVWDSDVVLDVKHPFFEYLDE